MLKRFLITFIDKNDKVVHIEVIANSKEDAVKYIKNLYSHDMIAINEITTNELVV